MPDRDALSLIPKELAVRSVSQTEIVLSAQDALQAIDHLEKAGHHVVGWEGWIRDSVGRVGHGNAPQGTRDLTHLSPSAAADFCRLSISKEAEAWKVVHSDSEYELFFCITIQGQYSSGYADEND